MQISKERQGANAQNSSNSISSVRNQLIRYESCVFKPGDIIEVRRLPSGKSTWHRAGMLAFAAEALLHNNNRGQHIYVGANPRRAEGGTKSKDVYCVRCLFGDFDGIDYRIAQNRWIILTIHKQ